MVVLNKIYTKTGDAGKTALGNGARVAKYDARQRLRHSGRTELLCRRGTFGSDRPVDEALAHPKRSIRSGRRHVPPGHGKRRRIPPPADGDAQVAIEAEIDVMNALEPLRSFILPGGSKLAAHLHVCRTVARRAERLGGRAGLRGEVEINAVGREVPQPPQ